MYSNFITPPDTLEEEERLSILIIDAEWPELEAMALFCKESKKFYNIHVYRAEMDNELWLVEQAEKSAVVVINTAETSISSIKDRLVEQPNACYYGPKNFLFNNRKVQAPVDYLKQLENDGSDNTHSL